MAPPEFHTVTELVTIIVYHEVEMVDSIGKMNGGPRPDAVDAEHRRQNHQEEDNKEKIKPAALVALPIRNSEERLDAIRSYPAAEGETRRVAKEIIAMGPAAADIHMLDPRRVGYLTKNI